MTDGRHGRDSCELGLQGAKHKDAGHGRLLAGVQLQLVDHEQGQAEDHDVPKCPERPRDGAGDLLALARAAWYRLVPKGRDRGADGEVDAPGDDGPEEGEDDVCPRCNLEVSRGEYAYVEDEYGALYEGECDLVRALEGKVQLDVAFLLVQLPVTPNVCVWPEGQDEIRGQGASNTCLEPHDQCVVVQIPRVVSETILKH